MNKKTEYEKVTNILDQFINQKCIKKSLLSFNCELYLYLGRFIYSFTDGLTKKIHLTTDYTIFIDSTWRLLHDQTIYASQCIYNDSDYNLIEKKLLILENLKLKSYTYHRLTNDLELVMENGYVIQTFNDVVKAVVNNEERRKNVFIAATPHEILSAQANGVLVFEDNQVEYITDAETNPEKYCFRTWNTF